MANSNCFLINVDTLETINFQFVPIGFSYNPEIRTQTIQAMSRNTPIYQNVGSEDIISFELHWVCEEQDRKDALRKCRLIESWAKNDGLEKPPALVKLVWGNLFQQGFGLFTAPDGSIENSKTSLEGNDTFIITRCSYDPQLFHAGHGMMPTTIIQQIELRRSHTKSRTREEISNVF